MAWPLPNTGQWTAAMGMTPDMNLGQYTVKEWNDMQQQNWQEWAQWQQQYSQWHQQYGEKYAQQYQTMQHMGNLPILLQINNAAPPVPPPPPEEPPPPPPHENNQPLFAQPQTQPAPVPPPAPNQQWNSSNYNNTNSTTGSNQSWSTTNSNKDLSLPQPVNADALKKLAEEERLFDVQFQKWEEEIDKWRKENVNHPDKQAYNEYEKKFESCRAQLMERRNQMKLKRANLLGNSQPKIPKLPENKPPAPAVPQQLANKSNYNQGITSQNYQMPTTQGYKLQNTPHYINKPLNTSQPAYNKNNSNVDPKDRYESYEKFDDNVVSYSSHETQQSTANSTSFLPTTSSSKVIPGLDLVHETDKLPSSYNKQDVIDITDDKIENHHKAQTQQPDYTIISKGINNILGDEKIMNILSMVCNNTTTNVQTPLNTNQSANIHVGSNYANNHNQNNLRPHLQDRHHNNYNNQQPMNRQNMTYDRQIPNYSNQQNQDIHLRYAPQKNMFEGRDENISQDQYYDHYESKNLGAEQSSRPPMYENGPTRTMPMSMKPNVPPVKAPFQEMSGKENINDYSSGHSEKRNMLGSNTNVSQNQPPQPKWIDEPLFTPSIIVEYEHKPLRLKARDFIEPVHMFDYNHISKDNDLKKIDFEKEVDELFSKRPTREREMYSETNEQLRVQNSSKYFERRPLNDNLKGDYYSRAPQTVDFERRQPEDRLEGRRRDRGVDDRDRYLRRGEDSREQDRHRDYKREDSRDVSREDRDFKRHDRDNRDFKREDRDYKRNDCRDTNKSDRRSRERESRKRGHSHDSEHDTAAKILKEAELSARSVRANHVVMIDDLLESPGREMRPDKIVIILRGPPGSGKSYLAKLIRDKEAEHGGTARIMSIDDYFMQEGEIEEKDPVTGKIVKKPTLKYEYDANLEESYINSLKRAFKRSLTDGYFTFLIYDAINEHLKTYADIWNYSRQNGFQVYVCTMDIDPHACFKRNIHNRTLEEIQVICTRFFPTPSHHIQLDPTTLLQSASIPDVHMEDVKNDDVVADTQELEVESVFTSKWEKMDSSAQLARLDGISKPLRPSRLSMEDYLQLDDWKPNKAKPGKKSVRWADLEERRQQEKMRAIGFVVGQTDWNRMTDPTLGSSALTQTKYIERVRRN